MEDKLLPLTGKSKLISAYKRLTRVNPYVSLKKENHLYLVVEKNRVCSGTTIIALIVAGLLIIFFEGVIP